MKVPKKDEIFPGEELSVDALTEVQDFRKWLDNRVGFAFATKTIY